MARPTRCRIPPRIVLGTNPHLAPQVGQRISRIVPQHPRPGIPHHLPDPLPHRRSITMHPTRGTVRFFTPERASLQPSQGIAAQFLAPGTKFPHPAAVPSPAVQPDHPLHHPPLTGHGLLSGFRFHKIFIFLAAPFPKKRGAIYRAALFLARPGMRRVKDVRRSPTCRRPAAARPV